MNPPKADQPLEEREQDTPPKRPKKTATPGVLRARVTRKETTSWASQRAEAFMDFESLAARSSSQDSPQTTNSNIQSETTVTMAESAEMTETWENPPPLPPQHSKRSRFPSSHPTQYPNKRQQIQDPRNMMPNPQRGVYSPQAAHSPLSRQVAYGEPQGMALQPAGYTQDGQPLYIGSAVGGHPTNRNPNSRQSNHMTPGHRSTRASSVHPSHITPNQRSVRATSVHPGSGYQQNPRPQFAPYQEPRYSQVPQNFVDLTQDSPEVQHQIHQQRRYVLHMPPHPMSLPHSQRAQSVAPFGRPRVHNSEGFPLQASHSSQNMAPGPQGYGGGGHNTQQPISRPMAYRGPGGLNLQNPIWGSELHSQSPQNCQTTRGYDHYIKQEPPPTPARGRLRSMSVAPQRTPLREDHGERSSLRRSGANVTNQMGHPDFDDNTSGTPSRTPQGERFQDTRDYQTTPNHVQSDDDEEYLDDEDDDDADLEDLLNPGLKARREKASLNPLKKVTAWQKNSNIIFTAEPETPPKVVTPRPMKERVVSVPKSAEAPKKKPPKKRKLTAEERKEQEEYNRQFRAAKNIIQGEKDGERQAKEIETFGEVLSETEEEKKKREEQLRLVGEQKRALHEQEMAEEEERKNAEALAQSRLEEEHKKAQLQYLEVQKEEAKEKRKELRLRQQMIEAEKTEQKRQKAAELIETQRTEEALALKRHEREKQMLLASQAEKAEELKKQLAKKEAARLQASALKAPKKLFDDGLSISHLSGPNTQNTAQPGSAQATVEPIDVDADMEDPLFITDSPGELGNDRPVSKDITVASGTGEQAATSNSTRHARAPSLAPSIAKPPTSINEIFAGAAKPGGKTQRDRDDEREYERQQRRIQQSLAQVRRHRAQSTPRETQSILTDALDQISHNSQSMKDRLAMLPPASRPKTLGVKERSVSKPIDTSRARSRARSSHRDSSSSSDSSHSRSHRGSRHRRRSPSRSRDRRRSRKYSPSPERRRDRDRARDRDKGRNNGRYLARNRYDSPSDSSFSRDNRGDLLFKCTVPGCLQSFASRSGLAGHLKKGGRHTDEEIDAVKNQEVDGKDFKCGVPGCRQSFTSAGGLSNHLKRGGKHSNEEIEAAKAQALVDSFKCPVHGCNRSFGSRHSLTSHKRTHTPSEIEAAKNNPANGKFVIHEPQPAAPEPKKYSSEIVLLKDWEREQIDKKAKEDKKRARQESRDKAAAKKRQKREETAAERAAEKAKKDEERRRMQDEQAVKEEKAKIVGAAQLEGRTITEDDIQEKLDKFVAEREEKRAKRAKGKSQPNSSSQHGQSFDSSSQAQSSESFTQPEAEPETQPTSEGSQGPDEERRKENQTDIVNALKALANTRANQFADAAAKKVTAVDTDSDASIESEEDPDSDDDNSDPRLRKVIEKEAQKPADNSQPSPFAGVNQDDDNAEVDVPNQPAIFEAIRLPEGDPLSNTIKIYEVVKFTTTEDDVENQVDSEPEVLKIFTNSDDANTCAIDCVQEIRDQLRSQKMRPSIKEDYFDDLFVAVITIDSETEETIRVRPAFKQQVELHGLSPSQIKPKFAPKLFMIMESITTTVTDPVSTISKNEEKVTARWLYSDRQLANQKACNHALALVKPPSNSKANMDVVFYESKCAPPLRDGLNGLGELDCFDVEIDEESLREMRWVKFVNVKVWVDEHTVFGSIN